jgi:hypothetical protein
MSFAEATMIFSRRWRFGDTMADDIPFVFATGMDFRGHGGKILSSAMLMRKPMQFARMVSLQTF